MDKPKMWITREAFDKAPSGFHFCVENENKTLLHKTELGIGKLVQTADGFVFDRNNAQLKFDSNWNLISELNVDVIEEALVMRVISTLEGF